MRLAVDIGQPRIPERGERGGENRQNQRVGPARPFLIGKLGFEFAGLLRGFLRRGTLLDVKLALAQPKIGLPALLLRARVDGV
ncbi:hypothetical protein [Bradyrhizobium sp. AZCC 1614]|uniref:hypothetical protein n=1 Tax=Bradyrhizobium sp. AZCC 1614 TaxID=3117017 RepID=UPI002FEEA32E